MACNYFSNKPRHAYTPGHNNFGNPKVNYFNCIGNHFYARWSTLINYYPDYKDGIMPFSGGKFEQPSKFVDVMDLVHNLIKENEKNIEQQEKLRKR